MELIMQNMDMKRAALEALRKKIAKLELELGMEDEVTASDDMDIGDEKRPEKMASDALAEAEAEAATEGEDGEKGVSIEMEMESDDPAAAEGMEDLYKRMADEFSAVPASRAAAGSKKGLLGGMMSAAKAPGKKFRK
jgi:hypothetical protein